MTTVYRITAQRRGRGWQVQVEGVEWPARFAAEDLSEAERSARRLIWAYTGRDSSKIDMEVLLPRAIADRLYVIGQYRQDLDVELRDAFAEMTEIGLSIDDIERVFMRSLDHSADEVAPGHGRECARGSNSRRLILVDGDQTTAASARDSVRKPEAAAWG